MDSLRKYVLDKSQPMTSSQIVAHNERTEEMMDKFTVRAVKCETCGKLHDAGAKTFFTVHGNINIGMSGGIVGNNFDTDGRLFRFMAYCRNTSCFNEVIDKLIDGASLMMQRR